MIADLKPYADYKDSGLPWLGQVPRHWDVSQLAKLARVKSVVNQSNRQLLSVYLQRGVVRFSDVADKRTNTTSEDLSKYQAVDPGDFVLNNQQAWRGSVGVSDFSGIVSPAYLVLALSKQYLACYANLLFRDQSMVDQYLICSKGVGSIQRNLYWPHLKSVGVVVPPPAEQAAIVSFLDWANGRLERAIRAKRKVIALLNEQKQAIIHRAVTRGLDPSVPLKPSGIPWVGEIPEHWEVVRTKNVCRIQGGFAFKTEWFKAEGIPVIRMSNLRRGDLDISEAVRVGGEHCLSDYQLSEGDILYGLSGSIGSTGSLGNFAVVRQSDLPAQLNQRVARFRPNKSTVACDFLVLLLQTSVFYEQVLSDTTGTAQFNVSTNDVGRVAFALPSLTEQVRIVSSVAEAISPLNITTSRLEGEIALLREYRTRLVADVVTGKLDVREAATRLPDEVLLPDLAAADEERDDMPIEEEADA